MANPPVGGSFTVKHVGRSPILITPCDIAPAFDPATQSVPTFVKFQGLWDTGATSSFITQAVVDACALKQIGITQVQGIDHTGSAEVYLIAIGLMNNQVKLSSLGVAKGRLGPGIDVLIGMDVITHGDFAITNLNGNTVFSFCVPSARSLDFVQEHNAKNPPKGFRGFKQPPQPKRHK